MILPVYLYGQPVLRKVAHDIEPGYPKLNDLIKNMFETMYASDGIGLAAPQIGVDIRLFILDLSPISEQNPEFKNFRKIFINAHITEFSEDLVKMEEGCLSLPGIHESVERSVKIKIRYVDENFQAHEDVYSDFFARAIQHEYEHIDGKLFIDKISGIRKQLLKSKLNSIIKGKIDCGYKVKAPQKN